MPTVPPSPRSADPEMDVTRVDGSSRPSAVVTDAHATVDATILRGDQVGRYLIVDLLGAGGMGEVYSAYDPKLDRRIALKLVKLGPRDDTTKARDRLLREAQALAKLSHPNVVAVHDAGTHDRRVFIAMEYVEGRTLRDWLGEEGSDEGDPERWRHALELMQQAGRGLAAAHAQGLVHRDFKPANVMVSDDGRVRVLDFGLARRFGETDTEESSAAELVDDSAALDGFSSSRSSLRAQLTQTGMVMGTPAYMAPEQFYGGHIDERTDQFAFCVVAFRALFGQRPFAGQTFEELGKAVSRGQLEPVPKATRVPRDIQAALRRGLSVSRDDRHPSMNALLAELTRGTGQGRRRLYWIGGAVLLSAAVGGAMAVGAAESMAATPCSGAESKLAGVWDDARRTAVAAAFEATGLAYADDVRTTAERSLDDYTGQWVQLHTEVCEATRVRGDQSEALMDLRIGCLDGKLRDVTALTALFAEADATVVENAVQGVRQLPRLEDCARLERDASGLVRPADGELAARVDELREQIAMARARGLAGKYDDAVDLAKPALEAARDIGYDPAIAEAAGLLGQLHERQMQIDSSQAYYEEGLYAAEASGHGELEALTLTGMLSLFGIHRGDVETAMRYGDHASAVTKRLGNPLHLDAAIALYRGNALASKNRHEEAREQFNLAARLSEGQRLAERVHLAALNNLAVVAGRRGQYNEAVEAFLAATEFAEQRLGPWHPSVGSHHNNLGVTYSKLERFEEAIEHLRRSLEVYERTFGEGHPEIGRGYHNLGVVQAEMGDTPASYESYLRALELKTRGLGPDHPSVAFTANNVGNALVELGRPAEAIPHIEDALRIWKQVHGDDGLDSIYGWISLGEARLAMGEPHEAIGPLRRALELAKTGEFEPVEIARARFGAAQAIWRAGGDRDEARAMARQAREGYEASQRPSTEELAQIDAWLAKPR